jgi:DNA topoisomerase-2
MNSIIQNNLETKMENDNNELFFNVQQKTDKQHILDNPDTYIGSVESIDSNMWIFDDENNRIYEKNINYIPGLYKLFDEGIVNCRDHVVRMLNLINNNIQNALPVSHIDISIESDGTITMLNDGNGIDIAQKDGIWLPELVFGHLRTSTNYDKTEKKIVGGKNGFGFKLVLIWSSYGKIETIDHIRELKYVQEFKNNLNEICTPRITNYKSKPYTKIIFKPDYKRLGLNGLDKDMIALFKKRCYDISAITDKNIKVKYNQSLIPIKNFIQYIDLYIGADKIKSPRVYETDGERWEYAVALTPISEFLQVSFVNGIHTSKGGKHVEYILNKIIKKLVDYIEKKKKTRVNANSIKEQLILFLRCDIENPSFDSQTKDYLNTPSTKFGSKCEVSDKFIEKIAKMGVMEAACALTEVKENKVIKKSDGNKSKSVRGIPKLTDANWAGTDKSNDCILILCEGDSAKAGILSGLSSNDRNIIGVYPLKGKLLNVRGEPIKKIADNKEITEIKQILGLVSGKIYNDIQDVNKNLRYSKVLFMTDQDLDGSHIKGLCINLFSCEWQSLIQIPGFIGFMNTPILKAKKGNYELNFYNDGEFNIWKENNDIKNWKIKYYKGLGTSTGKEFREYFINKKLVNFNFNGPNSNDCIDMVFNKKRSDDRKNWLKFYDRTLYLDTNKESINYEDFINKELIHFSKYDCDRSIPNLMDGLKISQRKILYSAFKRNLINEIKVAQFSGYVSEHSGYHHGEASLNGAIIGMAQNFVGSNNINLFVPNGQFGTRLQGGKDSASERYIFTYLNKITRYIFPENDEYILDYLNDDGFLVEPIYYIPIIPMILVNGTKGIGTGFSTDIMCYNPLDIINYIQQLLNNTSQEKLIEFIPYYEGFNGTITKITPSKFLIKGCYKKISQDKIKVTELPIGFWTYDFKELLEYWINPGEDKDKNKIPPIIKDYEDNSKDSNIDFTITFTKGKLDELENIKYDYDCNGIEKILKLYTTNSTTNMHLFDANDTLQKYENIYEIIDDYFKVRLNAYQTRKDYLIRNLEKELLILKNKVKYIKENLDDTIDLRKKKKEQIIELLNDKGYSIINDDIEFKYLIKMPMDSVSEENVNKLINEYENKNNELELIKNKTINTMWLEELELLKNAYINFTNESNYEENEIIKINKKNKKNSKLIPEKLSKKVKKNKN